MHEGLVLLIAVVTLFCLGAPLAAIVNRTNTAILSLPFGLAVAAVLVTGLYVANLPIAVIRWVLLVAACIGASLLCWQKTRFDLALEKNAIAVYFAVLALLALPAVVGGVQFSVFLGNIWDHFNYLTGSLIYSKHSYRELLSVSRAQVLSDPMLLLARDLLSGRPTVFLLFSLILFNSKASFILLSYLFLAFLLSLTYPCIHYLVSASAASNADVHGTGTEPDNRLAIALVPAAFPLGFWGQYILDIDAWSQIASIGLLALYVGFALTLVSAAMRGQSPFDRRHVFGAAAALGGAVLIYPENTLIHVGAVMVGLAALWIGGCANAKTTVRLALVLPMGLLGAFISYRGVVLFSVSQLSGGVTGRNDWWVYFQRFLIGRDNFIDYVIGIVQQMMDVSPAANRSAAKHLAGQYLLQHWADAPLLLRLMAAPINLCLGVAGLYFLTTPHVDRVSLLTLGLAIELAIFAFLLKLVRSIPSAVRQRFGEPQYHFLRGVVAAFLGVIGLLALKGQIWSAGKGLAFLSPYIVVGLGLPAMRGGPSPAPGGILRRVIQPRFLAFGYIGFAICLSIARITIVGGNPDGTHFASPYPSILHAESKRNVRWDFDLSLMQECSAIEIDVKDAFQRQYVSLLCLYSDKRYHYTFPIRTSYHQDPNFEGVMPPIQTDCRIHQSVSNGITSFEVEKHAS